jgi:hypothetical protein
MMYEAAMAKTALIGMKSEIFPLLNTITRMGASNAEYTLPE